ncbi:MAG TPA: DUF3613 domain-containing protein [Moraxellaceae bacterium]
MKTLTQQACLWLALLPLAAVAAEAEKQEAAQDSARAPVVQNWLDLQRSGAQASKTPQTLTPLIQERVVKRYLDSFNAPIPVFYADISGTGSKSSR